LPFASKALNCNYVEIICNYAEISNYVNIIVIDVAFVLLPKDFTFFVLFFASKVREIITVMRTSL